MGVDIHGQGRQDQRRLGRGGQRLHLYGRVRRSDLEVELERAASATTGIIIALSSVAGVSTAALAVLGLRMRSRFASFRE
ncbi:MAG: hypothetical protein IJF73_00495 [Clostridia bacterium]|nr:hypothetical protein [Clostridia bacterium]